MSDEEAENENSYASETDTIRIFLKVKPPLSSDKVCYNISTNKRIISILDSFMKEDTKKPKPLELDKIFTKTDVNSYVYEEIMRNCVSDCLSGINFTFVSYGDANSDKYNIILGTSDCYENINMRGLFPRFLNAIDYKIESTEKYSTNSISISYILINKQILIDLGQLNGYSLEKITLNDLIKRWSKEIKVNDENNIKSVKKILFENTNDSLFFVLKLLKLLYKLEDNTNHLLSYSYFIIIIYITDNNGKSVSTLNFIIMPDNDVLFQVSRSSKRKLSAIAHKRRDSGGPLTLNTQTADYTVTVEEILTNIGNIENSPQKITKSYLLSVMGNISFDKNNILLKNNRKYRILGSMSSNSNCYSTTKDTLSFLARCKEISKRFPKGNINKIIFNEKELLERVKAKDDQIYDLESKVKTQEEKLKELEETMENKENNLKALRVNYKQQIESLKRSLGFHGNINNLLIADQNSDEYQYTLMIRNTTENNRLKNTKINELKKQIQQIICQNGQLKTLINIYETDSTMIGMLKNVKDQKERQGKEVKTRNEIVRKINDLLNKNEALSKKITMYKEEITEKQKVIQNLPSLFRENQKFEKCNSEEKRNKIELFDPKKDLLKITKNENIEKKLILKKYENILQQGITEVTERNNELNKMMNTVEKNNSKYLDELISIYKYIIKIINLYKNSFSNKSSIFTQKDKFDKFLSMEEKSINSMTFPLLYEELGKKGFSHFQLNKNSLKKEKPTKNIFNSKTKQNLLPNKKNQNDKIQLIINELQRDYILEKEEELKKKNLPIKDFADFKKKIFSGITKKTYSQLLNMNEPELKQYTRNFKEKINEIENFINTYYEPKNDMKHFNPANQKIYEIVQKIIKLNGVINDLAEKNEKTNKILERNEDITLKIKNENSLIKQRIKQIRNASESLFSPFKCNREKIFTDGDIKNTPVIKDYNSLHKNNFSKISSFSKINNYTKISKNSIKKLEIKFEDNNLVINRNVIGPFTQRRPISSNYRLNAFFQITDK